MTNVTCLVLKIFGEGCDRSVTRPTEQIIMSLPYTFLPTECYLIVYLLEPQGLCVTSLLTATVIELCCVSV